MHLISLFSLTFTWQIQNAFGKCRKDTKSQKFLTLIFIYTSSFLKRLQIWRSNESVIIIRYFYLPCSMMLMLFTWFLSSVPLSCFAFIPDNTENFNSVIGELTDRLADLEERLSTQEHINKDLETRLIVQEKRNREQEDLIKALFARTCITSKQAAFERQQVAKLHKKQF